MKNKKIPLIIDCDPGCDDSLALIMLYNNIEKFDIKLIASTAGNTPIEITTRNLQFFANNYFKGVKLAKGLPGPLVKSFVRNAEDIHGETGMGGFDPGKQDYPYEEDSCQAMYEVLKNATEPVVILALGPITNVARLIVAHPDVKSKIDSIYAMIGSVTGHGNITPCAEFNAYFDPEALDLVVKSGVRIVFNPIELAEDARIPRSIFENHKSKNATEKMAVDMMSEVTEISDPVNVFIYDPNSVAALTNPDLYDFVPCDVVVSTCEETSGKCVMTDNPNGIHRYQKIKNIDKLNNYILSQIFK